MDDVATAMIHGSVRAEVVRLGVERAAEAGATLARAFSADPMIVYLMPNEHRRVARTLFLRTAGVRHGVRYGVVDAIGDGPDGVAIWYAPGQGQVMWWRTLGTGTPTLPARLGLGGMRRFRDLTTTADRLRQRSVPEPHWYLSVLGVDPARRRQGLARALLRAGLARADEDGVPSYLETMNVHNLPLYRRHGFEVVADVGLPHGGPHLWAMRREPEKSS